MSKSVKPDAGDAETIAYSMVEVAHVPAGSPAPGAAGFVSPPKQLPLQSGDALPATANIADATVVSATE